MRAQNKGVTGINSVSVLAAVERAAKHAGTSHVDAVAIFKRSHVEEISVIRTALCRLTDYGLLERIGVSKYHGGAQDNGPVCYGLTGAGRELLYHARDIIN